MPQPFPNPIGGLNRGFQTGFNMARAKAQDKLREDIPMIWHVYYLLKTYVITASFFWLMIKI